MRRIAYIFCLDISNFLYARRSEKRCLAANKYATRFSVSSLESNFLPLQEYLAPPTRSNFFIRYRRSPYSNRRFKIVVHFNKVFFSHQLNIAKKKTVLPKEIRKYTSTEKNFQRFVTTCYPYLYEFLKINVCEFTFKKLVSNGTDYKWLLFIIKSLRFANLIKTF